jgi:hypothetical protein
MACSGTGLAFSYVVVNVFITQAAFTVTYLLKFEKYCLLEVIKELEV